ncbi:MAG: type II toxin-antitoxin system RelE/ParE family toxin [Thermomicrobiales bacterium]
MAWEIEYTEQFDEWFQSLSQGERNRVIAAVNVLERSGPGLGRPFVDTPKGSRHANMKELRPRGGNLRILFAFDPRRAAILLIGGDKSGRWRQWYEEMIPIADDLYDEHLAILKEEGLLP